MERKIKETKILFCIMFLFFMLVPNSTVLANESFKEFTNAQEATTWGINHSGNYLFSDEQRQMFKDYTYNSRPFNSNLRKGIPFSDLSIEEQKRISILDEAVVYPLITENIIVYRYANIDFFERLGYSLQEIEENICNNYFQTVLPTAADYLKNTGIVGKIYQDPGFLSTTLVRNSVFTHRPIELRIKVRKWKNATFLGYYGMSFYPQELELLFPRDEKLRVENISLSSNNKIVIETQMLGPYFF
ncbi:C3 family ADP-ribosyltransferase [Enterococcus sp. AZ153]|uniref:ADP-ribosyltransferase n=1 Tax=unclassified Enterococcus TaxID=2608891 RepID=UPI003F29A32D